MSSITKLSLRELYQKLHQAKNLKCVNLIEQYVKTIKEKRDLNAIVYFNKDDVLKQAIEVDRSIENGQAATKGRLFGLPLIVKDNIHIKNIPNTAGCPALKNFIPKTDAPVIEKLRNEGALFLAKTNMHEMAFGATTNNKAFGPARNAHNPDYSAGGSSGGSGNSIGSYMAPAGLGSDTGGSVRIPSSVNGIYGLRPTQNRYPHGGVTPISHTRDTVGVMGNHIDDLVYLDEIITNEKFLFDKLTLKGLRIGIPNVLCEDLNPEVKHAFEQAKKAVQDAGAVLVDVEISEIQRIAADCGGKILFYEPYRDVGKYLQEHKTGLTIKQLFDGIASPDVKVLYRDHVMPGGSKNVPEAEYKEALNVTLPKLKTAYTKLFLNCNICSLLFPTLPILPVRFDAIDEPRTLYELIRNTNLASVVGVPGLSIPMGKSTYGLPIGLEIDGLENTDQFVLGLGGLISKAIGNQ